MNQRTALVTIARAVHGAGVLLFVAVLYVARDALMPLTLGGLLAFLLSPAVNRMQRWGLSNAVSVLLTAVAVFTGLSLLTIGIWSGVSQFVEDLPGHQPEIIAKIQSVQRVAGRVGGRFEELSQPASEKSAGSNTASESQEQASAPGGSALGRMFRWEDRPSSHDGSTPKQPLYVKNISESSFDLRTWAGGMMLVFGPIGTSGLVTVFALFALLYRDDLRDRFTSLVSRGNYVVTAEALNEAAERIGKYLFAQLILNISYGIIFSLGLLGVGYFFSPTGTFPYVLLLGTLAGLARFVPYIGPIAGAGLPFILSLIVFPGYQMAVAVASMVLALELISNNFLEPWLYGSSTGVSPVAVILAAVFWGWLWGPIGLLLATPLTVCAVVLGQYVPRFRFLNLLLSEKVPMNVAVRGYQRLLSGDSHKLADLLQEELKQQSPARVIDDMVIPIVKQILRDNDKHGSDDVLFGRLAEGLHDAGLLSAPAESTMMAHSAAKDISAEQEVTTESVETSPPQATSGTLSPSAGVNPTDTLHLIGVAARHRGEELVLHCLAKLLPSNLQLDILDREDLHDPSFTRPNEERPLLGSLVLVIPPQGVSPAREMTRLLRRRFATTPVLAACLGRFKRFDRLYARLQSGGANGITTSVAQTAQRLNLLAARSQRAQGRSPAKTDLASDGPTVSDHAASFI